MLLDEALTHVAVLGSAGKMGSGIAFLLLQEMSRLELEKNDKTGTGTYSLNLIDVNATAFPQLRSYLRDQLFKYAEKNINSLRKSYAKNKDLTSNEEIIEAYVLGALDMVYFDTSLDAAKNAHLIFEAIVEDEEIKAKVFREIVKLGNTKGYFLSNTSSIPIHVLDEKAHLNGRIIGFHFYNPPAVQKLLEIIAPAKIQPELSKIASELAKRLKKTIIYSSDVAGFIGNGHLIREVAFACKKVEELSKDYSLFEAIYMVNRVTQEWLIRPMGIFQLMDYVGLDVCRHISQIMDKYLHDPSLKPNLIEEMVSKGILGGQNSNGTQKNGFFAYESHHLKSIYSIEKEKYISFADSDWIIKANRALGPFPKGHYSWKALQKEPHKEELLKIYFVNLQAQNTLGDQIAQAFLQNSCAIANELVQNHVAASLNDVSIVLKDGFYHLYRNTFKNWIYGFEKTPVSKDRN